METILLLTIFISFFVTFLVLPFWIKKCKEQNLVGKDIHKLDKREVAEAGGVTILLGFLIGILLYIAIKTFLFKDTSSLIEIFSILCVVLIASIVGLMDDLLGWKKGLSKKIRIGLMIFTAIPLMVINAGKSDMLGIEFGLLYPLFLIPLGVIAVTTVFNFLAGYNGLEARQGILLLSALAVVTFFTGNSWLSLMAVCMVATLIAFLIFNSCPASVFPGDVMTYSVGALIASIVILGNVEKIAVFFFIPYIIEMILKVRGGLTKESFGKLNEDGSLEMPYKKIYGLEHLSILILKKIKPSKKVFENDVVLLINIFQIIIIGLGFLLFRPITF